MQEYICTFELTNSGCSNHGISFLTNYSGPLVEFPCPTPIHMKETLKLFPASGHQAIVPKMHKQKAERPRDRLALERSVLNYWVVGS